MRCSCTSKVQLLCPVQEPPALRCADRVLSAQCSSTGAAVHAGEDVAGATRDVTALVQLRSIIKNSLCSGSMIQNAEGESKIDHRSMIQNAEGESRIEF
jgi:hypothetical protein